MGGQSPSEIEGNVAALASKAPAASGPIWRLSACLMPKRRLRQLI